MISVLSVPRTAKINSKAVTDLWGREGCTPSPMGFFFIFMQFSELSNRSAPPGLAPPGKSWIRHCKGKLQYDILSF